VRQPVTRPLHKLPAFPAAPILESNAIHDGDQFLIFVKTQRGRMARVHDVSAETIQAWMDDMAAADLALETMRMRQSAVSSFCAWLVKRQVLPANPVARLDRPPHRREAPT